LFGIATARAQGPIGDPLLAKLSVIQQVKTFDVQVKDEHGTPISGVTVTPWALRSSQGHGRWGGTEERAEMEPEPSSTNVDGIATICYPYYRDVDEQTRTFSVSVLLTHADFTVADSVDIDVPLLDGKPHTIEMKAAASITLIPKSTANDFRIEQIHLVSSDPSQWKKYPSMTRQADRLCFQMLCQGPFRGMLIRLVDGQAVEFSDSIALNLKPGENNALTVTLHPAISIRGRLSENVPRPVVAGRVAAIALWRDAQAANFDWTQWAAVDAEGNFEITGWPRSESIQVIALCEHFIARNGIDPNAKQTKDDPLGRLRTMYEMAKEFSQPSQEPSSRPQVFGVDAKQPILVQMTPLVRCTITVTDLDNNPLADVFVGGNPNVFWWNWGSQIYGGTLMRSTEWLTSSAPDEPWDSGKVGEYDSPFFDRSDATGSATVYLPPGAQTLFADSKLDYQLPIFMGRRDRRITIVAGEELKVAMKLEPTGTETLGEYDKLAGVVFGCSTRQGKQICALPEVRQKMDEFARRLREADDPRDPAVLSEAFTVVAEAFSRAGDPVESAKWQVKANTLKAKLNGP